MTKNEEGIKCPYDHSIYGSSIKDFEIGDKIGKGGFGEVFKARCKTPGFEKKYVAIKRISKKRLDDQRYKDRTQNEINIHSRLFSHTAFVQFYISFEDKKYYYIVMELCDRGSLEEYLKHKTRLPENEAIRLIKEVICGVVALHRHNIIHRDISMKNLLLTKDYNIKIADFGFAVKLDDHNQKVNSVLGTPKFMAPEVVNLKPYDFQADIWSIGCVLYALLYGSSPINKNERYKDWQLKFPDYASREAKELLMAMLRTNPTQRVSLNEAQKYEIFKKWEKTTKINQNLRPDTDSGMSSFSNSLPKKSQSASKSSLDYHYGSNYHKPKKKIEDKYVMNAPVTKRHDHIILQKQNSEHVLYQERYESQYESPVKNRIEYSSYPAELQYLTERNINSQITNSDVEPVSCRSLSTKSSNLKYRNTIKQNSNTCFQKLNSYQQIRSDSCQSLGKCTTENKKSMEERNTFDKEDIVPLNTARLKYKRQEYKRRFAMVTILSDGQVCFENFKLKDDKKYVHLVYLISGDGLKITVCKLRKNTLLNPDQPLLNWTDKDKIRHFSLENLPDKHRKKYSFAKNFVDNFRGNTKKVIVNGKYGSCAMMENTPNPNFEVTFYNGFWLREKQNEITIKDKNGCIVTKHDNIGFMLKEFESMKHFCKSVEEFVKTKYPNPFPCSFGGNIDDRKREFMQDNNKENMPINFLPSSTLNGLNFSVKCDKSIENSLSCNSYQYTSTPYSDKNSVTTSSSKTSCNNYQHTSTPCLDKNSVTTSSSKTITNLPSYLKKLKVIEGYAIADYTNGSQLFIHMKDNTMFYKDDKIHVSNIEYPNHPAFVKHSKEILRCLRKEREKKT